MEFTFILSLYTLIFVIKWRVGEVIHVVFKGHPQRLVFGILILTVESHRENLGSLSVTTEWEIGQTSKGITM